MIIYSQAYGHPHESTCKWYTHIHVVVYQVFGMFNKCIRVSSTLPHPQQTDHPWFQPWSAHPSVLFVVIMLTTTATTASWCLDKMPPTKNPNNILTSTKCPSTTMSSVTLCSLWYLRGGSQVGQTVHPPPVLPFLTVIGGKTSQCDISSLGP